MTDEVAEERRSEESVVGVDCCSSCASEACGYTATSVALGQLLSLLLCGTAVTSQLLSERFHVNTPTTQSFANYLLLCAVYGTLLACRNADSGMVEVLRRRGWRYLLVALVDVEANFLIVLAYQYTSLTSIQVPQPPARVQAVAAQILDCFTLPVVLLLSWLCLSVRYLLSHLLGVALCVFGIAALILADALGADDPLAGGSNKPLGDVLCLCGAALYGFGNVAEEALIKSFDRVEYLGMVGLFGSAISGIQLAVFERNSLANIQWSDLRILVLYGVFALCMFAFYSLVAVVVSRSSATMFNLSILSTDFYSLVVGLFIFRYKFHLLYFFGMLLVVCGVLLYSLRQTHKADRSYCANLCCPLGRKPSDYSAIPPPTTAAFDTSAERAVVFSTI